MPKTRLGFHGCSSAAPRGHVALVSIGESNTFGALDCCSSFQPFDALAEPEVRTPDSRLGLDPVRRGGSTPRLCLSLDMERNYSSIPLGARVGTPDSIWGSTLTPFTSCGGHSVG
jgi:hypothetical protein